MTGLRLRPASPGLAEVARLIDEEREAWIDLLMAFIRHPSRTGALDEVRACGSWFADELRSRGWRADLVEPGYGAPVILATHAGPPAPRHLLLYSHYDVISPEPLSAWTKDPFGAERADGRIYGRGAMDAKANVLALVAGAAVLERARGALPCSLTLILDGEEEAGSNNLPAFVDLAHDRLAADAVVSFDGAIDPSGRPKIGLGTSGMLFVELRIRGTERELHSAQARLFPNPAWRLVWALASIKRPDERVEIAGFGDAIRPPAEADRRLMAAMSWDPASQLREVGLGRFVEGADETNALERLLFTPGLTICGIESGYTGPGMKAVIPADATAKLEFRVVPDQEPATVLRQLRAHLDRNGFEDVEISVLATVETARTDADDPLVDILVEAARDVYDGAMVKPTEEYAGRQGAWLGRRLGIPGAQTGVGPPGARGHAADEFVTEDHYLAGVRYAAAIIDRFGRTSS